MRDTVEAYGAARERGVRWLLQQTNADGSIGPVAEGINYYRVPWALAVCGRTGEAMRVVAWVKANMFTPDGDFRGRYPRGDFATWSYPYPNSNLIYGAQLLRQYDISYPGIRFLIDNFHDPQTGGFGNSTGSSDRDGEQAMFVTCQAGLSCLITGHLLAAEKVGTWLQRVWEAQPHLPGELYTVWSPHTGLVTDLSAKSAEERKAYVVDANAERQRYYQPGIAAAFLGRLFLATGEPTWLELARRYQQFALNMTEKQFEVPQVCKTGWGAAVLYTITGEQQYRRWAARVGDYYRAAQFPDGHWENVAPYQSTRSNVELTAEFVVHLDTLIGVLSG